VCPKHVDPAGAIHWYKLRAAFDWILSFVKPGNHKIQGASTEAAND